VVRPEHGRPLVEARRWSPRRLPFTLLQRNGGGHGALLPRHEIQDERDAARDVDRLHPLSREVGPRRAPKTAVVVGKVHRTVPGLPGDLAAPNGAVVAAYLEEVYKVRVTFELYSNLNRRRGAVFYPDLLAHASPELAVPHHLDPAPRRGQGELSRRALHPRALGSESTAIDPEDEAREVAGVLIEETLPGTGHVARGVRDTIGTGRDDTYRISRQVALTPGGHSFLPK